MTFQKTPDVRQLNVSFLKKKSLAVFWKNVFWEILEKSLIVLFAVKLQFCKFSSTKNSVFTESSSKIFRMKMIFPVFLKAKLITVIAQEEITSIQANR